ncbi:hypothetical protein E4U32_005640, partial [Claviceps aff. humidiphila group G2b]
MPELLPVDKLVDEERLPGYNFRNRCVRRQVPTCQQAWMGVRINCLVGRGDLR